jgi:hypothetical protein
VTESDESLLELTKRKFSEAMAESNYAAAIESVRWLHDASGVPASDDPISRKILDGYGPTKAVAREWLLKSAFFGDRLPPEFMLYLADLMQDKGKRGRRPSPVTTRVEEIIIEDRAGELRKNASSSETYEQIAQERPGLRAADSMKRRHRSMRNRDRGTNTA